MQCLQARRSRWKYCALILAATFLAYFSWSELPFTPGFSGQRQHVGRQCSSVGSSGRRQYLALAARGGETEEGFAVGDWVKARCPDDDQWYPGTIDKTHGDGTFSVKWDSPDGGPETHDIAANAITKIIIFKDYKVGQKVEAIFPDDGNYYPGEVTEINEGTFTVKWDDPDGGPETSELQPAAMKYPPIPFEDLEVGQKYTGTVRSVLDFGAFVDIGAEANGLLHISRISKERIDNVYDYLSEGQEIACWISEKREDGKFGLTMVEEKIAGGGPRVSADLTAFQGISPDDWQNGVVAKMAPFGAFVTVTLEDGSIADGLVHVSQIRDGFVDNVEEELSMGQEVKVRVQSVDLYTGRMSLSMKGAHGSSDAGSFREPEDLTPFQDIASDKWLTGKVAKCVPFGVFVTVTTEDGASADGLVHITQISDGFTKRVEDELSIGQKVQVRIQSIDVGSGKMTLSMKQLKEEE
eukprot:TRINITY_DN56660_c0_g1_i1.p1 TRINITY_DN56660_c0_g1~~TRINITY_DN56660_c0_g1_i1.p1  ORF type:complete len:467 (-),score=88.57 TRINITY_DN56660_c0_g1_i1:47-1447(-)